MKSAMVVVVMFVLSMADARPAAPKAMGITKVSHNVCYGVLFFVT